LKVISHSEDTPLKEKVLIADDSISAKTGKNIELVSYHFDHKAPAIKTCHGDSLRARISHDRGPVHSW
jgi:hypothetical protein